MKSLEHMARELFDSFCEMQGEKGSWEHLSEERRNAWRKDVMVQAKYFLVQLQKDIKPLPNIKAQASYEMGFYAGQRSERLQFQQMVEDLYNKLEEEYDNLQEN